MNNRFPEIPEVSRFEMIAPFTDGEFDFILRFYQEDEEGEKLVPVGANCPRNTPTNSSKYWWSPFW